MKKRLRSIFLFFPALAFMLLACPALVSAQSSAAMVEIQQALKAYPLQTSVSIDGRLDEPAWQEAESISGFLQFEPNEGEPASQATEVQVLYGPRSLYIGATLYDDDPNAIEQALGRRDEYNRADWFLVSIDSYFDRRTAYIFGVSVAGVQLDAIRAGGGGGGGGPGGGGGGGGGIPGIRGADESWDAIWYSNTRITPQGWVAEIQIPYSMLRFPEAESQTWGIHFTRKIPRYGEESEWPLVPRTERSNLVAQFGLLTGINEVSPRRNIQLRPYTLSQLHSTESLDLPGQADRSGSFDAGMDFKLGIGSNVTLDATVNPDFGQVESDPAVLNLTAFETFYDERRPFFVEGAQIFDFQAGPGQLLYTRRIGAEAPIVGAAKLSGRTGGGLSFGVLGASTGDDFSPNRHYGAARLIQQIGTYSSAGGILTAFNAPVIVGGERRSTITGGADWDIRLMQNRYGVEGFSSFTHRMDPEPGLDSETGFAGKVWLRKRQGAWTGFAGLDVISDKFNPNDLGQIRENNFFAALLRMEHEINESQPFGPFLRASAEAFANQRLAYDDGRSLGFELRAQSRWMLKTFQTIELGVQVERPFGGYDLFETRGLDPWSAPASIEFESEFQTDERRSWDMEPEIGLSFQEGGGRTLALGLRGNWNVGTQVLLSANVEAEWEKDNLAWSSNESFLSGPDGWYIGRHNESPDVLPVEDYVLFESSDALNDLFTGITPFDEGGAYYVPVFGRRDTRSIDFTLRSTVTFTPTLSLQLYGQFLVARGRYGDFQLMQNPDELVAFDAFPKRDEFALSSLQSNIVLRWEYRPGSVVFLVWTHHRQADDVLNPLFPWDESPYDRAINQQISDTFNIFPDNVFLVKLGYTFLQ